MSVLSLSDNRVSMRQNRERGTNRLIQGSLWIIIANNSSFSAALVEVTFAIDEAFTNPLPWIIDPSSDWRVAHRVQSYECAQGTLHVFSKLEFDERKRDSCCLSRPFIRAPASTRTSSLVRRPPFHHPHQFRLGSSVRNALPPWSDRICSLFR